MGNKNFDDLERILDSEEMESPDKTIHAQKKFWTILLRILRKVDEDVHKIGEIEDGRMEEVSKILHRVRTLESQQKVSTDTLTGGVSPERGMVVRMEQLEKNDLRFTIQMETGIKLLKWIIGILAPLAATAGFYFVSLLIDMIKS